MQLVSTRDNNKIGALACVLKGISDDGGLYIPSSFPALSLADIDALKNLSYAQLSAKILGMYFEEIDEAEMLSMTKAAYSSFDDDIVVPIKALKNNQYIMELFHGPTLAFKDIALQILPHLMAKAVQKQAIKEDVLILVATSGDTGKAALEGFCDVDRVKMVVFYPNNGVSNMQKLQMVTQEGNNTHVLAVNGNFDDTQNGVKHILTSTDAIEAINKKGYVLSSANSINIGRLTPQIVYYFWAYLQLLNKGKLKLGDTMNVAVPTGNFGNILAAYYAKKMGLPIGKFICASNTNKVLTDFFKDQTYSLKNRAFIKTMSPSMDILISSNLERLVADVVSSDTVVKDLMLALKTDGEYKMEKYADKAKTAQFYAGWASEPDTLETIKSTMEKSGYLADPHTAVGIKVANDYIAKTGDEAPLVIAATANPYKFSDAVLTALKKEVPQKAFAQAEMLAEVTKTKIPAKITELKEKAIRHTGVIEKDEMLKAILADI